MSAPIYPWRWLSEGVGTTFVLRYPWIDALREAARGAEAVCLLVPEAAGPLADWSDWLAERIDGEGSVSCLCASGDFLEVSRALALAYQFEEGVEGG
jgi:hypothetical protein